jgi:hypothetical protein
VPTLADLVVAAPHAIRLVCAPSGADVPLGAVRVAAPRERTPLGRGDLVLAVGEHLDLTLLMADANAARAAAVVARGSADALRAAGAGGAVAVLRTTPGTTWEQAFRVAESLAGPVGVRDAARAAGVALAFAPLGEGEVRHDVVPAADPAALRALAAARVERLRATTGEAFCAGIGAVFGDDAGVAASRADAERVVAVLRRRPDLGPVATVDDVRPHAALAGLRRVLHDAEHLRLPQLAALRDHDAERGTSFLPTLRSYLDTFGDAAESARALGVPVNTFRYRLRRLVALAGIDLDDADERLVCELQLAAP